jgi:hypothetical protein
VVTSLSGRCNGHLWNPLIKVVVHLFQRSINLKETSRGHVGAGDKGSLEAKGYTLSSRLRIYIYISFLSVYIRIQGYGSRVFPYLYENLLGGGKLVNSTSVRF